jgi:hypothetical protein
MPTSNAKPSAAATRAAAKAAQAAEARAAAAASEEETRARATLDGGGAHDATLPASAKEATMGEGRGEGVEASAKRSYSSTAASHPFAPSGDADTSDGGDILEDELVNEIIPSKPPTEPGSFVEKRKEIIRGLF